ncbi:hypothetical protein A2U01_0072446, partial [Trifolium medium]|nr:hypothetical protein [Trifolium medium]
DVAVYAVGTEFDGHIYVEHNVSDVNRKVSEHKCNGEDSEMESGDESDYSDDAHGVTFNDSE